MNEPPDLPRQPTAAPPPPLVPPVGWTLPPQPQPFTGPGHYEGGPPAFTLRALLSDTFARYGADPVRLFALSAAAVLLGYAGSILGNPFTSTPAVLGLGALLSLLGFVVSIVVGSSTFALLEGGRNAGLNQVLRRGIGRAGWFFLTTLLLGLGAGAVMLVAFIPAIILFLLNAGLAIVALLVVFVGLIWLFARFTLAFPANVVDDLNSIDAMKVSWRITRPAGVWLRIVAGTFLLGLLVAPASLGSVLLLFPGMFGQPLLIIAAGLLIATLTPLTSLLLFSAYRRLVPARAAVAQKPAFVAPRLGAAGVGVLTVMLVLGVGGIVSASWVVGEVAAGRIALPVFPGRGAPNIPGFPFPGFPGGGRVAPGTVAFGTSANLATCTVQGRTVIVSAPGSVAWVAALTRPVTPSDQVRLVVLRGATEITDDIQDPATYLCLGTENPETGIERGVYTFEVYVNDGLDASGTLFVQ